MAEQAGASPDPKRLYRKLESTLERIERIEDHSELLEEIVRTLLEELQADLNLRMGRIYRREGDDYLLCCALGGDRPVPLGYRVPRGYPPHVRTLEEGLLIMRKGDPGFDEEIERTIGVDSTFAAITVGRENGFVLAFSVDGEIHEEQILYSLTAVRHAINLKLEHLRLASSLAEARLIQESLLPVAPPVFEGYELHGISHPAEAVGGDLFDYLPHSARLLGIAIADASGHGLPAALLARDVITGLRVGIDEHLKVVRVVERLNRVIHRATLSSKFISLFYGELEPAGYLTYCNAGHNPPLLCHRRDMVELHEGGMILGPNPEARYQRGHVRLEPDDLLLLYTDGLVERENRARNPYGTTRLRRMLRRLRGTTAKDAAEAIMEASERHARGTPQLDDVTVVVVRRVG